MTLVEYLATHRISQAEFAKKFSPPITQGLVSQWINGTTRVTLDKALEIESLTGGAVTTKACSDMFKAAA